MLTKNIIRQVFSKIKPLKIQGQTEGAKIHFISKDSNIETQNALEALLASLAACQLGALKAISKGSNLKINNVKFTRIESGLDLEKFMKGGPQSKLEDLTLEAQVDTNVTQQELDEWMKKAYNSCPVYQMLKAAGVKIDSRWKKNQSGSSI